MEIIRRLNLSLALFVAICFFLPWVQASCGAAHHSESGFNLARHGDWLLWLIPLMMVIVFALGLARDWMRRSASFSRASLVCGAFTAFLIFRERTSGEEIAGLVTVSMTTWFWLGFIAALGLAVFGLALMVARSRAQVGKRR